MAAVLIHDSREFAILGLLALGVYAHAPWWALSLGVGWFVGQVMKSKEITG
jgi:hypothetical protein